MNIYQNGIFYLPSNIIPGLQLADLAAYLINRVSYIKERAEKGKESPFDNELLEIYDHTKNKFKNLL